ncbi:MAG TPA: lipoprotein [Methylosinus sp.]|jgi:predicted small lipoprotein YifL|uniref:LPS translocon maturation chaperone LptM n=1 Tax=Hyphomicrobiales TaxID=356 RepID=UPI002F927CA5
MADLLRPRSAATLLILALALAGCGRRGALDYPPEVAARPKAVVVQKTTLTPVGGKTPVAEDVKAVEFIPGTPGYRPPDQYPFILDPLID